MIKLCNPMGTMMQNFKKKTSAIFKMMLQIPNNYSFRILSSSHDIQITKFSLSEALQKLTSQCIGKEVIEKQHNAENNQKKKKKTENERKHQSLDLKVLTHERSINEKELINASVLNIHDTSSPLSAVTLNRGLVLESISLNTSILYEVRILGSCGQKKTRRHK